jgi:hypothetical protein
VIPLALFAIVATTATMGAAAHVFWQASGHRYADEILRQQLHQIDVKLADNTDSERSG